MAVRVEFYGLARQRAGTASIDVDATTVGSALRRAAEQVPSFAAACIEGGRLAAGYLANVNGRAFTSDALFPVSDGDVVLILSADAGG